VFFDGTIKINASWDDNISKKVCSSNDIVTDNTWYHIVSIRSGVEYSLWVDGVKQTNTAIVGNNITLSEPLVIGARGTAEYVRGQIDEPRIYNRALTEAEITQNYNAGKNKHRND